MPARLIHHDRHHLIQLLAQVLVLNAGYLFIFLYIIKWNVGYTRTPIGRFSCITAKRGTLRRSRKSCHGFHDHIPVRTGPHRLPGRLSGAGSHRITPRSPLGYRLSLCFRNALFPRLYMTLLGRTDLSLDRFRVQVAHIRMLSQLLRILRHHPPEDELGPGILHNRLVDVLILLNLT